METSIKQSISQKIVYAGSQRLMPIILATQEAEIRWFAVQVNCELSRLTVREALSQKTLHKNRGGGVAQGEDPAFKPQYHTHKKSLNIFIRS
jgi:hypothetical protein